MRHALHVEMLSTVQVIVEDDSSRSCTVAASAARAQPAEGSDRGIALLPEQWTHAWACWTPQPSSRLHATHVVLRIGAGAAIVWALAGFPAGVDRSLVNLQGPHQSSQILQLHDGSYIALDSFVTLCPAPASARRRHSSHWAGRRRLLRRAAAVPSCGRRRGGGGLQGRQLYPGPALSSHAAPAAGAAPP